MVFLEANAKLVAKLVETNVLPDDTINEVNIMTWAPSFLSFMYSKLERIRRKDSESESRPFSRTIIVWPGTPFLKGISPKKGTLEDFWTSILSWIVVSNMFRRTMKSIGTSKPNTIPIKSILPSLGAIGTLIGAA